ncbi:MAG: hydrogenase small subunit [Planctomycetota bacterium]
MKITRRDFLKYCTASAAALGLNAAGLKRLEAALASNGAPTIIWLHGSGCQGDSVSFLNLFANLPPVGDVTAGSVLLNYVNLAYHTVVMASASETAVTMAMQAKRRGGYVLACEGGVATAFDGRACNVLTINGEEKTYQQMVLELAADAAAVLCIGTCASYGGIPRAVYPAVMPPASEPAGPTGVLSVKEALAAGEVSVPLLVNVPGCPSHPDWVAWVVVQLILGNPIALDAYDRPTAIYGNKDVDSETLNIHENCPRNVNLGPPNERATTFGQDFKCLEDLGCRGPLTFSDCPARRWNKGEAGPTNWCIDANAPCIGCVEPDFPGGSFYA